jgi:hypothetical protein
MASSLIKVNQTDITSTVSTAIIDGIDSTYDVYLVVAKNIHITVDTAYLQWRVVADVAGVPTVRAVAEYDYGNALLRTWGSHSQYGNTGQTRKYWASAQPLGNSTGEKQSAMLWLYNFANASEYSYVSVEELIYSSTYSSIAGDQGGFVYTVAEALTGIAVVGDATSMDAGTLVLYGLQN